MAARRAVPPAGAPRAVRRLHTRMMAIRPGHTCVFRVLSCIALMHVEGVQVTKLVSRL